MLHGLNRYLIFYKKSHSCDHKLLIQLSVTIVVSSVVGFWSVLSNVFIDDFSARQNKNCVRILR